MIGVPNHGEHAQCVGLNDAADAPSTGVASGGSLGVETNQLWPVAEFADRCASLRWVRCLERFDKRVALETESQEVFVCQVHSLTQRIFGEVSQDVG